MSFRGLNVAQIPAEGRLLRVVQRVRTDVALTRQLAEMAREVDQPLPRPLATLPGDRERLRGIPIAGNGGAIKGTRPDTDALRSVSKLWSLAALARDIDGTSPGSQPEQALLDKEAETLAALESRRRRSNPSPTCANRPRASGASGVAEG